MQLAIDLLTLVLVVIALFLGLLILVQLPKKEAGITAAFGAESTAALFGAGSGTALSNITKWCAGIFLLLCFVIAIMTASESRRRNGGINTRLKTATTATVPAPLAATGLMAPATNPAATVTTTVTLPVRPATNTGAAK